MSITYAREQLGNAVFASLATGVGTIQERLVDAWSRWLIHISSERDLPEDLRPRWEIIRALVTQEGVALGARMDDEAAVELAHQIVDFQQVVESLPDS